MKQVDTGKKALADYKSVVGSDKVKEIKDKAEEIGHLKTLHINATAYGGGPAGMLHSLIPLANDVGVNSDWQVLSADDGFFDVTKTFHNCLQGDKCELTPEMKRTYLDCNQRNALALEGDYDLVVLHDPQPLAMIKHLRQKLPEAKFVWRCHIDLTDSNHSYESFLRPYMEKNDAAIFSSEAYRNGIFKHRAQIIHPAIDPLSDKNRRLTREEQESLIRDCNGIDLDRPFVTQISRFDPWKDPLGVVEAYQKAKKKISNLQLVLAGSLADDDPEGVEIYNEVARVAEDDSDLHVLKDLTDKEVNALQSRSDVILQKSLREGFGLTVSEALWKGSPVIGSDVGGIPLQIKNQNCLVSSVDQCAGKLVDLINKPDRKQDRERRRRHVRENFLVTRHLEDYLDLFGDL